VDQPTNNRINVLWIGRMIFGHDLRVREAELANRLGARANVFALDHTEALNKVPGGIGDKLRMRLELFRAPFEVLEEGPVTRFRMPVAVGTGPWLNEPAAEWNERMLRRALDKFGCDRVFLSSPFFFMPPEKRDYELHYDVIDNFHDQWPDTRTGRARREFHAGQLRRADSVSASSLQQCDYVKRLAGRAAVYIPNGAPLHELRSVPETEAVAVRAKYRLEDRFVLGYIGNHTHPYYGMERIVRALVRARETRPELALLVVGPGGESALEFCRGEQDGVFVTGPVPPAEVGAFFHASGAGVHPYDPRPQTHDAMALNVIEFSACGKPVLSNPLKEFQRLQLPNVRFTVSADIGDWVRALLDPASFADFNRDELDRRISDFDWDRSARKLWRVMTGEADASP